MHKFLFTHTGPGRIFIKFPFILTVPGKSLLKFTLYSLVLSEFWSNCIYFHKSSDCYTQFLIYTHGPCGILPKLSFLLIGLDQCFVLKWIHYSQFRLHYSGSALTIIFICLYYYIYIICIFIIYISYYYIFTNYGNFKVYSTLVHNYPYLSR